MEIKGISNSNPFYRTIKVNEKKHVFTKNGHTFAFTRGNDNFMDFTHVHSGFGFNGGPASNMEKCFQGAIDRVGEESFWRVVNKAPSVEKNIQEREDTQKKADRAKELYNDLRKVMNHYIILDRTMLMCNVVSPDVIAMDEKFKRQFSGEYPSKMSMSQLITKKWGKETHDKFNELINGK